MSLPITVINNVETVYCDRLIIEFTFTLQNARDQNASNGLRLSLIVIAFETLRS